MEENKDQNIKSNIKNLLLSADEMAKKYRKLGKDYDYPYFYKITKNGQSLYFLGAKHVFSPDDPQFKTIKKYWSEFLSETGKNNCIVLVEGGERPVEKLEREAKKHGEPSFTTYMASRDGVQVVSPEPGEVEEVKGVTKKFGRENTLYYYFARRVAQWNKLSEKPDFETYLGEYLARYDDELDWEGFDSSIQHMIDIHNKKHDHEFDEENYLCFYKDSNPIDNEVSRESSLIRNIHMTSEIIKLWNKGKNIFIVYGSGHSIVLEPALKKLLSR